MLMYTPVTGPITITHYQLALVVVSLPSFSSTSLNVCRDGCEDDDAMLFHSCKAKLSFFLQCCRHLPAGDELPDRMNGYLRYFGPSALLHEAVDLSFSRGAEKTSCWGFTLMTHPYLYGLCTAIEWFGSERAAAEEKDESTRQQALRHELLTWIAAPPRHFCVLMAWVSARWLLYRHLRGSETQCVAVKAESRRSAWNIEADRLTLQRRDDELSRSSRACPPRARAIPADAFTPSRQGWTLRTCSVSHSHDAAAVACVTRCPLVASAMRSRWCSVGVDVTDAISWMMQHDCASDSCSYRSAFATSEWELIRRGFTSVRAEGWSSPLRTECLFWIRLLQLWSLKECVVKAFLDHLDREREGGSRNASLNGDADRHGARKRKREEEEEESAMAMAGLTLDCITFQCPQSQRRTQSLGSLLLEGLRIHDCGSSPCLGGSGSDGTTLSQRGNWEMYPIDVLVRAEAGAEDVEDGNRGFSSSTSVPPCVSLISHWERTVRWRFVTALVLLPPPPPSYCREGAKGTKSAEDTRQSLSEEGRTRSSSSGSPCTSDNTEVRLADISDDRLRHSFLVAYMVAAPEEERAAAAKGGACNARTHMWTREGRPGMLHTSSDSPHPSDATTWGEYATDTNGMIAVDILMP